MVKSGKVGSGSRRGSGRAASGRSAPVPSTAPTDNPATINGVAIDPYRALIFPNAIREQRRRRGIEVLLTLSAQLPTIPYIRLSKIERGEVVPKAWELRAIAAALDVAPQCLLINVESPDYTIALWAGMRGEALSPNRDGEILAMLLAAAFRTRRAGNPELTLARLQSDYRLPPVIVSRIENASKTPDRWNAATLSAICRVLGVADPRQLADCLHALHAGGMLFTSLARIPGAEDREIRTRNAIARLRSDLESQMDDPPLLPVLDARPEQPVAAFASDRAPALAPDLPPASIMGIPVANGLISLQPTGRHIQMPHGSGPRAYPLQMGRPSLGVALPGHAVLIVDPDRYPINGGPAVIREGQHVRVVAICLDREGRLMGHSNSPEKAILIDDLPPDDIAMVTAILFP